mmetsp:Transcript_20702/g.57473  ORF Transcript_20702/g.57473 Transcript_20702/m.57473 type:complete len:207 (-) Transcript_20702:1008-1628(-)
MPLEVKVHALAEALLAQHGGVQTDDLRTLLIHSHGVEVFHLDVALRADGVGHGASVLRELPGAQHDHIFDALHRAGVHVRGELLVAVHSEALLQCELEPVAAGDPVASPVVEILMAHNTLNAAVVDIRGGLGGGQHQPGVEDVEGLVLHGAHVEVMDSNNVEEVQVVLEAKHILIPLHGLLETLHGEAALGEVVLLHKDAQLDLLA